MSDERKPVWPWIVALLIGLPVLYELSIGPAVWLNNHGKIPHSCQSAFSIYVIPTNYVYDRSPKPVQRVLHQYVLLWTN
jgi:hypothetical protein